MAHNSWDINDSANSPHWYTGKDCVEPSCIEPAGTAWSPYWCWKHNAERMDRISASLENIVKEALEKKDA